MMRDAPARAAKARRDGARRETRQDAPRTTHGTRSLCNDAFVPSPTPAHFRDKYGPCAVVAGGSYGLGAAFAEALAERGLNLILIARDAERLDATAARLREAHGTAVDTIAADIADHGAVARRVDALGRDVGLLIYDAAYAPIGPFADAAPEDLAKATAVNVTAPALLARHLAPAMVARGRGGIVFMSSLSGLQGSPNIATYAATKAFNTTLAEGLWHELRPRGVDVLACVAGAIATPGYEQASQSAPGGQHKQAPGTLPAATVAATALDALARGRGPVVVPGATNKLGRAVMTRLLPRRAAIALMARNTKGLN